MSSEDNSSKKSSSSGWAGGFSNLGASLKDMGNQMEEKLRQQQAQFQEQQQQSVQSADTSKGGGLMSRLGSGLNKQSADEEDSTAPTTPSKNTPSDNTTTTPTKQATTPLAQRTPDDVSKEELLEILKKMNTRVKALSQSRIQLSEKVKQTEKDKARLLALVKNEILDENVIAEATEKCIKLQQQSQKDGKEEVPTTPDEVIILQTAYRTKDEQSQLTLQHIQNEFKIMTLQSQAQIEKVKSEIIKEKDQEIARMKEDMKEALSNVEKDGGFGVSSNGGGGEDEVVLLQKKEEELKQKDEEIGMLMTKIQSLQQAASEAAISTPQPPSTTTEGSNASAAEEEIATLKKENQGLKIKFKGHIEKVNLFKSKVAEELKKSREEASSNAKIAEDAKKALEEAQNSIISNGVTSNEASEAAPSSIDPTILAEKDKRIQELETSLLELKPLHTAEVEKIKEELTTRHETELKETVERELEKVQKSINSTWRRYN